jgi:autotransporter-associated beta strand protein
VSGTSNVGTINVNAGILRFTSQRAASVGAINVANGASLYLLDTTSFTLAAPFSINGTVTLNGDGANIPGVTGDPHILGTTTGSGAFVHTLDEAGSAVAGFNSPITLAGDSRFTLTALTRAPTDTVTTTFLQPIGGVGGLIKDGEGTMILAAANTYTGATTVTNGKLAIGTAGSINATPTMSVQSNGTLDVSGTTGFTVGGGSVSQTLQGTGTVLGNITIGPKGTIRGGIPGTSGATGTLTITGNLVGTSAAGSGVKIQVTADGTTASKIQVSGTDNFVAPSGSAPLVLEILNGGGLSSGTSYTRSLVSAAGGFLFNGTGPVPANTPVPASSYTLTSPDFSSFTGVSLAIDGTGTNLVLTFTPVPEPLGLFAVGAVVGVAGFVRRRRR